MAADFIDAMLTANLAVGAAILFVLIVRGRVKHMFGPRVAYGLWMAVPLAGAATFLPAPVIHVPTMAASSEMSVMPSLPMSAPAQTADAGRQAVDAQQLALQLPVLEYGALLLLSIWVVGFVASAGTLALRQKRFIDALGRLRARTHDGTTMFLCESANIGPAVVGMIAPRIILPSDFETRYSVEEQMVVLAHERVHLERGDAQLNGLVALLRCLCWFNPLVHLAVLYQRRDQEMACDATVIARHFEKRRAYAQAMLKAQLAQDALPLGCYWPARSEHPLKARIASLESPDRRPAIRWTGIAAVSISSLCAGYAAWATQPPKVVLEFAEQAHVADTAQPNRKPGERIFVPFVGAERSPIRPQISQESDMTKQTSPAAMIGRAGAALLLGAAPGLSTGGTGLVTTVAIAQPAASSPREPDPWAGTPGRDAEQAGLRVWARAANPLYADPAEYRKGQASLEAGIAAYFKEHPDAAAEREAYYAEAVKLASAAVRQGDARAMYLLAGLYRNGWGVEKSDAKSMALIRRAAEAGDMTPVGDWTASGQAMLQLAWTYDTGGRNITNRNPAEAAKWYRQWAGTVRPGTKTAPKVATVLERLDTPEYLARFVPFDLPTLIERPMLPGR